MFPELHRWHLRLLYEVLQECFPDVKWDHHYARKRVYALLRRIAKAWDRRGLSFADPHLTAFFQDRGMKLCRDYPLTLGSWMAQRQEAGAPLAPPTR